MGVWARLGRSRLTIVAVVGTVMVLAAFVSVLVRGRPAEVYYEGWMWHNGPSGVLLLWLSRLVLTRRPGHAAGRALLVIAGVSVLHVVTIAPFDALAVADGIDIAADPAWAPIPAELPLRLAVLLLIISVAWVPAPALAITVLLLVFPDGHLPSRRWRPVAVLAVLGIATLMLAFTIDAWPTADWPADDPPLLVDLLVIAGGLMVLAGAVAGVAALLARWRRTDRAQRSPFRVVGLVAICSALVTTVSYPWQQVWTPAVLVAFNALFLSYGLAVARYRLHDLEPVLGRATVAVVLVVGVALLYVGVVVGLGSLVGTRVDNVWLPLLVVALVGLLIEPARRRVRALVDRQLYRRSADRTEVLAQLAARASSETPEQVLADVADLLVSGTGATRAEVCLDLDGTIEVAAASGTADEAEPTLRRDVVYAGQRLGELRLFSRAAADLVPDAGQVLADAAHGLAVVLRNARLTAQLRAQVAELARSRERLVDEQARARRALERDIHDGAQSRLIAVRLRVGLAAALAEAGDLPGVGAELAALAAEVEAAVRSLRDLARGVHPPILAQSGPAAALAAHVRNLPVPVTVHQRDLGRYPASTEAAVYFACLEAVQNAVRHGRAGRVDVDLAEDSRGLTFRVEDDGIGFDPGRGSTGTGLANLRDRIEALGGTSRVDSAHARGTRVEGWLPVAQDRVRGGR
ncbi:sensor histidine kinase [Nocardioides limicola]|uniref:sensor histidine kinase n=1 Tax=Nocardioides limicola TaxID=2803368 RepID=UPI00193BD8E5|nr:ATP-binding protein [Nocardioides sp. DJM-14]